MSDWADEIASKYFYPTRFVAWGLEDRAEFAATLRKARADALEEAVAMLELPIVTTTAAYETYGKAFRDGRLDAAKDIRALKDKPQEGEK